MVLYSLNIHLSDMPRGFLLEILFQRTRFSFSFGLISQPGDAVSMAFMPSFLEVAETLEGD